MNETQKRVVQLLESAEPKENLKRWATGKIPKHYKRLSISMDEAKRLACFGATKSIGAFGTKLYFTQSLLMGAALSGTYKKIIAVTPSQYGKSWTCGQIALLLANNGEQAYVAGAESNTTEIIMGKVIDHIQYAHADIQTKLLESADKIERLQTSVSKRKLTFKGGGSIEALSLGDTYSNPLKGNKAIGRGGNFILDEASLVSDDAYAEMGRREFANEDGESYISFEISNPHNPGRFFDKLTAEVIPKDTLVVWMDARTAYEEGRIKSIEQVTESEFFQNKSTCRRYFLCELEDYTESSLFSEPQTNDDEPQSDWSYYLGVDSAYKGKDNIEAVLSATDHDGMIRVLDHVTINKQNWVDGVTSAEIIQALMKIVNAYHVKQVCVDVGYGVYLVEGLAQRASSFSVRGINFGSGTTEFRKKAKHYSAVYGSNKRAEMHLDLADLIENKQVLFSGEMKELLKDEMNAVQAVRKPNGKTAIIAKDEIKTIIGHSPDKLDATLLSIHACLLHSMTEATLLYQE